MGNFQVKPVQVRTRNQDTKFLKPTR